MNLTTLAQHTQQKKRATAKNGFRGCIDNAHYLRRIARHYASERKKMR